MADSMSETLGLVEAARLIRTRQLSSVELVNQAIQHIERLEPQLHALLSFYPEQALEKAAQADERVRLESENLPELWGVPVLVKDVLAVAGMRCTCGSKILENYKPPFNATAVERILAAGVIILGKTNTDEFAMGSSTENSAYGVTHNPWNLERVPGGSSGGSAAAVSARYVPAALGTDTGGSVRQPASFCGLVGLKPTYGRVSRYGLVAFGSSLDCVGTFTTNVQDAAALFRLIAGRDGRDATSVNISVPEISFNGPPGLAGLRIGLPGEYFIKGIQEDVNSAIQQAVAVLSTLGAEIVPVSLPHTDLALPVYYLVAPAEASANLARYDGIRFGPRSQAETILDVYKKTRGELFGAEVKRRIMLGTYALSAGYYDAYYGQAQKVRLLIQRDFAEAFKQVDVLAAPVAPTTAFPIGGHGDDPLSMYLEDIFTLPANLAGIPALALPVGFDRDQMPIGLQLMGSHFTEALLFRVAHEFQKVTQWHSFQPGMPWAK